MDAISGMWVTPIKIYTCSCCFSIQSLVDSICGDCITPQTGDAASSETNKLVWHTVTGLGIANHSRDHAIAGMYRSEVFVFRQSVLSYMSWVSKLGTKSGYTLCKYQW